MACISNTGDLYTWGVGLYGELGLGEYCQQTAFPMLVPKIGSLYHDEVVSVSCARHHTLALTNEGYVFAMGESNSGKLGTEDENKNIYQPEWIDSLASSVIAQIVAGDTFSCAVSLDSKLFMWGSLPGREKVVLSPERIDDFGSRQIRQICSNGQIVALLVQGFDSGTDVYTFGGMRNKEENYVLGHQMDNPEPKPRVVENVKGHNVEQLSIGKSHVGKIETTLFKFKR